MGSKIAFAGPSLPCPQDRAGGAPSGGRPGCRTGGGFGWGGGGRARARRGGGPPPISAPRKRTEPALGLSAPAMRLNTVLLPEPLGPIRPRISPSATSNETLLTAVKPPKLFVSCSTFSKSRCEGVTFGKRQNRVGRLDGARPRDMGAAADVLRHHRERALVLAGELRARRGGPHPVGPPRGAPREVRG